ncbi:4004_t:CDS:1, partial [Funneliformis geosporum]
MNKELRIILADLGNENIYITQEKLQKICQKFRELKKVESKKSKDKEFTILREETANSSKN